MKGRKTGGRRPGSLNKATADVKAAASKYGPKALKRLAWLMDNAVSHAAQVAACKELLDRAYGKAPQALVGDPDNPVEERRQVEIIFVDSPNQPPNSTSSELPSTNGSANLATIQLQKLVGPQICRIGKWETLTPRELAVLRLLADGNRIADAAKHLRLGDETVRSHVKKAQVKLGARNSMHAVVQAIRRQLIV